MKQTLIKCGWLVTLDSKIGEMKDGELLISGDTIKARGRNLNATRRRDHRRLRQDRDAGHRQRPHAHLGDGGCAASVWNGLSADYFKHVHSNLGDALQARGQLHRHYMARWRRSMPA